MSQMTTATTTIVCGDCLEVMRMMPDNSVDLVFCSPPYEAARTYGIGFSLRGQNWVDWAVERYLQCVRVSRGLVAWVVEGQTRKFRYTATPALLMADLHRAGVQLRKPPVFHRIGIPGSGGPDWLRNDWEWIVCSSKGKLPWSNNTAMGHRPKWAPGGAMSNRAEDGRRKNARDKEDAKTARRNQWGAVGSKKGVGARDRHGNHRPTDRPSHVLMTRTGRVVDKIHTKADANGMVEQGYTVPVLANPGNVIRCNVGGGQMGSKLAHENEAPFPESLARFFILSFCPPGGVVLDPFCGSGTTLAVALRHGRHGLGVDIRGTQTDLSSKRIQEVHPELF